MEKQPKKKHLKQTITNPFFVPFLRLKKPANRDAFSHLEMPGLGRLPQQRNGIVSPQTPHQGDVHTTWRQRHIKGSIFKVGKILYRKNMKQ